MPKSLITVGLLLSTVLLLTGCQQFVNGMRVGLKRPVCPNSMVCIDMDTRR